MNTVLLGPRDKNTHSIDVSNHSLYTKQEKMLVPKILPQMYFINEHPFPFGIGIGMCIM